MRPRSACPAALAVVLLLAGQLAALAHNATTRHVTCDEHGEEQDAAQLTELLHACEHDHVVGVEGTQGEDHDDCAIARALHQSAAAPDPTPLPQLLPASSALPDALPVTTIAIASDLYLIAPKTSPPV